MAIKLLSPSGLILIILAGLNPVAALAQPDPDCAATTANIAWWQEIYDNRTEDRMVADALARDLLPCLASDNSQLRDSFGYGLYSYWLRNARLGLQTRQLLFRELQQDLDSNNSLQRSFSALILSELLRADAIDPFLSEQQRDRLLQDSSEALIMETDYRGLDAELGWVHPVAHMSDLLWRFALHPALTAQQARQVLQAVRAKATPLQAAYAFNEGDRLARVITQLLRRDVLSETEWQNWFAQYQSRADGQAWNTAFSSPEGMTELHNAKLFVRALSDQLVSVPVPTALQTQVDDLVAMFTSLV